MISNNILHNHVYIRANPRYLVAMLGISVLKVELRHSLPWFCPPPWSWCVWQSCAPSRSWWTWSHSPGKTQYVEATLEQHRKLKITPQESEVVIYISHMKQIVDDMKFKEGIWIQISCPVTNFSLSFFESLPSSAKPKPQLKLSFSFIPSFSSPPPSTRESLQGSS